MTIEAGPLLLDIATRSDVGTVRSHNEDVAFVVRAKPCAAALGVCDGMGGALSGERAAGEAAKFLSSALADVDPQMSVEDAARFVRAAVEWASSEVYALSCSSPELRGMGTTATIGLVHRGHLVVAQVGDSRGYRLRDGELTQLTRDQTLVQLMIERGQLTPEDAARSDIRNIILQAVGTAPTIEVDVRTVEIVDGDVLLFCSDGLAGPLTDAALAEHLSRSEDASATCAALVDHAARAGSTDNITCIVARATARSALGPPREDEPPPSQRAIDVTIDWEDEPADPDGVPRGLWSAMRTWWLR